MLYLLIKQKTKKTPLNVNKLKNNSLIMMCTPEVGLNLSLWGVFMIEYDKFDFKIKVFQEY